MGILISLNHDGEVVERGMLCEGRGGHVAHGVIAVELFAPMCCCVHVLPVGVSV